MSRYCATLLRAQPLRRGAMVDKADLNGLAGYGLHPFAQLSDLSALLLVGRRGVMTTLSSCPSVLAVMRALLPLCHFPLPARYPLSGVLSASVVEDDGPGRGGLVEEKPL